MNRGNWLTRVLADVMTTLGPAEPSNLPHVELVTDPIECVTASGVRTTDGTERGVDTIIYATGYETTKFASVIDFVGRDGVHLRDAWADGAQALARSPTTRATHVPAADAAATAVVPLTWTPNQQAARARIATGAATVVARAGIAGCTVRAVADEAAMTKSTVHYYLRDADELVDLGVLGALAGITLDPQQC